jgi:hypothetical protein
MGRDGHKSYKRLPPPMVVQRAAATPPGCVSVGGAIPAQHQYHHRDLPNVGRPSSRVHAGEVLVQGRRHRFEPYVQAKTRTLC